MIIINNRNNNAKITSIAIASILLIGSLSMTTTVFGHPQTPSLVFSTNGPVAEGTDAVMTGSATALQKNAPPSLHEAYSIVGADILIERGLNEDNSFASICPPHHYETLDTVVTDGDGNFSYDYVTTGFGGQTHVFKAHIAPIDPNDHGTSAGNSVCSPLEITVVECEGDIQISAIDTSENSDLGEFGYMLKVTACTDVENLKIQGGSNGWSSITHYAETPLELGEVVVKENKKNTVYSWKIDELSENDMVTFEVEMTSNIEISCDQTVQINGAWSVAYTLPEDDTKYKTPYTAPLTWTNEC